MIKVGTVGTLTSVGSSVVGVFTGDTAGELVTGEAVIGADVTGLGVTTAAVLARSPMGLSLVVSSGQTS